MIPPATEPVELSIVMPARDEAARLPQTLLRLAHWSRASRRRLEVVIADDGSRDDTAAIAATATGALRVRIIPLGQRCGAGAAVRAGVLAAVGERVLVCDADGPVPFDEIDTLWTALDLGADVAAGSRRVDPTRIEQPQPRHRLLMGAVWRRLVRGIAPVRVHDTQCGFKLFTRAAAQAVFSRISSRGFVFHVEALCLAETLGLEVVELPVRWRDVRGSRIHLVRDPVHMLWELCALAWRRRRAPDPRPADGPSPLAGRSLDDRGSTGSVRSERTRE